MYLERHPTSANGYYTRDLLTLVGPVKDLKVPRVREGDFHPRIPPLSEAGLLRAFRDHPCPLRCRSKHEEDLPLLRRNLRGFLFTSKHLSAHPSYRRGSESLAGKAPKRGVLRGVFGWDLSLHSSGKNGKGTRVHGFGDQARWTKGDPQVLAFRRRRIKRPELGGGA